MTMLQPGIVTYLEAEVPSAGKGYPMIVPQDAGYPAWCYQVIDDDQLLSHSGGTGFCKARVQIDIVAKQTETLSAYANAANIAKLMRAKLDGFTGNMGGLTVEYCKTTLSDDWADTHDLPSVSFDVLINYQL